MRECEWGEGESLNYGVIWCMIVIMMEVGSSEQEEGERI